MLEVGGVLINAEVEDIISMVQEETEYFKDVNELESDYMVTCAYHKGGMEDKPSLGINKETGVFHCFTCGEKGDVLQLLQDTLDLPRSKVIQKLAGEYIYSGGRRSIDFDLSPPTPVQPIDKRKVMSSIEVNQRAVAYLASRGIRQIVTTYFPIGYNKEHDTIQLYVQDLKGDFIYYKERAIKDKRFYNTEDVKKSNYLFGARQLLRYWDRKSPVWICESEIDCLTCWSRGAFAVAIGGSHISKAQLAILKGLGIREIYNGLDRDEAGVEGWELFKKMAKTMLCYDTIFPTNAKDINDLTESDFTKIKICNNLT